VRISGGEEIDFVSRMTIRDAMGAGRVTVLSYEVPRADTQRSEHLQREQRGEVKACARTRRAQCTSRTGRASARMGQKPALAAAPDSEHYHARE
jgi:hypothetical protein